MRNAHCPMRRNENLHFGAGQRRLTLRGADVSGARSEPDKARPTATDVGSYAGGAGVNPCRRMDRTASACKPTLT